MIRLANENDLDAIEQIYLDIHEAESEGKAVIGWLPGVYPVRATAEAALSRGDLYVYEDGGEVLASAIINRTQVDVYEGAAWLYPAQSDGAAVLHTLTVKHKGSIRTPPLPRFFALSLRCRSLKYVSIPSSSALIKNKNSMAEVADF